MATFYDNWQTKRPTISERTKFIFNNELLSDVKFVAPGSESRKSQKSIPAHKFVLAISSPVFYAMFYGEMAETASTIELPDCDYESLLELFRYLYSDEVNLTGSNVMQVLYFAKKYLVPSLADKCTEYLREHLEASNAFSILPQSQKFEDKDLEERCWKVIELHTEEAVTSDEFVTLERSIVESLVKRERLTVKEVDLFKAVDRWANKEVERQGLTRDGEVKRRVLGEEIVKAIRFPVMSHKEFASVVVDCDILTKRELGVMIKHYGDASFKYPLPFIHSPRSGSTLHRCYRFSSLQFGSLTYSGNADALGVTVSKPITLHGVKHFGTEGGNYTVSLEVKDILSGRSLAKQIGTLSSEKDDIHSCYGFDVMFNRPVDLEQYKHYEIVSLIKGPRSWVAYGAKNPVEVQGVKFSFSDSAASINGTKVGGRQFLAFLFSLR
ncbi:BTB/POZ domain-containing protein 6-like [Porites lutea]|uniref:BTB/POZ domain-containing protein 6-like n=1 Tax=Porites lutea TaxID=51062 RepID=UPI003CC51915